MNHEKPITGEVIAAHSGETTEREWNAENSVWLNPDDMIVLDAHGVRWFVTCRTLTK